MFVLLLGSSWRCSKVHFSVGGRDLKQQMESREAKGVW